MMVNSPETKRKPLELGGLAPNEVYDFHSAFPWNPNRLADGKHILYRGFTVAVDRGGMFAVIAFRDGCKVVGWSQASTPISTNKAEVLGMVILVFGKHIENHQAEHGFNLAWILRRLSRFFLKGLPTPAAANGRTTVSLPLSQSEFPVRSIRLPYPNCPRC